MLLKKKQLGDIKGDRRLAMPLLKVTCILRTISLLLDGLGLGHGETLHSLVFLRLRLVLMRVVLVLAVGVDQHSAVERVAVPPGTLAGPRDAVHCRGTRGRGSLRTCSFECIPPMKNINDTTT